jgi:hypothetical protein
MFARVMRPRWLRRLAEMEEWLERLVPEFELQQAKQ